MKIIIGFAPIILFILIYVGTGIYFTISGVDNAFYQLSPLIAIIPPIVLSFIICKEKASEKMNIFLDGVRHRDIIVMCIIFLLSGAFGAVTKAIGSVDATINLALYFVPPQFMLVGIFVTSAFISTAIGTSMGTIATIAPIAAELIGHGLFPAPIAMATVIGGAMFGDGLSIVSDTTIASVTSQNAKMKLKFRLNAIVAIIASICTVMVLLLGHQSDASSFLPQLKPISILLVLPYILLVCLPLFGTDVFLSLLISLAFTWFVGFVDHSYDIMSFGHDIVKGFADMQEIMILSLMVGGLSGFASHTASSITKYLADNIAKRGDKRAAQFMIAKIVTLFDLLFANNTIAIIFSGKMVKDIATQYKIPAHYSATWLSVFSVISQGLIPYGAQMLLAGSIANISPISIIPYVYYCYALALVSIIYIIVKVPTIQND